MPALQGVMAQLRLLHFADATLGRAVQLLPHLPQLFVSVARFACEHGKAQHGDVLLRRAPKLYVALKTHIVQLALSYLGIRVAQAAGAFLSTLTCRAMMSICTLRWNPEAQTPAVESQFTAYGICHLT
jgi:hypothetical protein